jgi:hypothetical protein
MLKKNMVKKVSKTCHNAGKKLQKVVKKLSKSCQKVVKKIVQKCQKVQNSTNSDGWRGGQGIVVPRPSASASLTGRRQKGFLSLIIDS